MDKPTRRIDPSPRAGADAVGPSADDPGNPAHREWADAGLPAPDLEMIREWRLGRVRAELKQRELAGAVLFDPINIRYATDTRNMQVYCMHALARYVFVAADGPVVLFDFPSSAHRSAGLTQIDDVRAAISMGYFDAGSRQAEFVRYWAGETAALVKQHGGGYRRIAIDRMPPGGAAELEHHALGSVAGDALVEQARAIKHPEEIKAMRRAIHTAETGMWQMWHALEPGRTTENELWSWLHQANIARGGEWIETRLLASGPRTNPWFQECSDRVIEQGDTVSFDTDLVGPYGYCADISRTWCAGTKPSVRQRELVDIALTHIEENARLIRPGVSFRELTRRSHRLPAACRANRYGYLAHGIGLCDEYPGIRYPEDWEASGYDGVFEAGMTISIEAYIGPVGEREGVKLERQALITEKNIEFMDSFSLSLIPE